MTENEFAALMESSSDGLVRLAEAQRVRLRESDDERNQLRQDIEVLRAALAVERHLPRPGPDFHAWMFAMITALLMGFGIGCLVTWLSL